MQNIADKLHISDSEGWKQLLGTNDSLNKVIKNLDVQLNAVLKK